MRVEDNKLVVGYHELAFSLRTQGEPIYAVLANGVQKIGETIKYPHAYPLPEGTLGILRRYTSNSGIVYFTYYPVSGGVIGEGVHFGEKDNFSVAELPEPVRGVIAAWLRIEGFSVLEGGEEK